MKTKTPIRTDDLDSLRFAGFMAIAGLSSAMGTALTVSSLACGSMPMIYRAAPVKLSPVIASTRRSRPRNTNSL